MTYTTQFLDWTAGSTAPSTLDVLTCANTSWLSTPAPATITPTMVPPSCLAFGYPAGCGTDGVPQNFVYEFGGGQIKMIIPNRGGHSFPRVLGTAAGGPLPGGGFDIRDFSLAQEACIWFGDGCVRTIGY
jgi:hypothetical protein